MRNSAEEKMVKDHIEVTNQGTGGLQYMEVPKDAMLTDVVDTDTEEDVLTSFFSTYTPMTINSTERIVTIDILGNVYVGTLGELFGL